MARGAVALFCPMDRSRWLLFATMALGVFGTGQVWLVQLSSYWLWPFVGARDFHACHLAWWHGIWGVVLAPALFWSSWPPSSCRGGERPVCPHGRRGWGWSSSSLWRLARRSGGGRSWCGSNCPGRALARALRSLVLHALARRRDRRHLRPADAGHDGQSCRDGAEAAPGLGPGGLIRSRGPGLAGGLEDDSGRRPGACLGTRISCFTPGAPRGAFSTHGSRARRPRADDGPPGVSGQHLASMATYRRLGAVGSPDPFSSLR